jgi:hypothetical protein
VSDASFAGSGDLGVKQIISKISDGCCEAKIPAREVAENEVTGDHGASRGENDDEIFHD